MRLLLLVTLCLSCICHAGAEGLRQQGQFPEQTVDADGDGVADIDDNCPATPPMLRLRGKLSPMKVDLCGCPIDPCAADADQDGIRDCDDLCPATVRGLRVTAAGCPKPQTRPQTFVLDVKFRSAEANLVQQSVADLEQLQALLLRFPELTVTLEGHTDDVGSARYNRALSEARAGKCRSYLLREPRIAPQRVRAIGYGESRPVADNAAEPGRALNRRTVAVLNYRYEFVPPNDSQALPP